MENRNKIIYPSEPSKYGLLYRSLCESTIPFTYFILRYAGKPKNVESNEASKFYIRGTDKYTKYLARETSKYNKLKGNNILMDRYLKSVSLAKWGLDEQSITIVEMMRHDRKEIPKMLHGREEKSTVYVYSEDSSIMSRRNRIGAKIKCY